MESELPAVIVNGHAYVIDKDYESDQSHVDLSILHQQQENDETDAERERRIIAIRNQRNNKLYRLHQQRMQNKRVTREEDEESEDDDDEDSEHERDSRNLHKRARTRNSTEHQQQDTVHNDEEKECEDEAEDDAQEEFAEEEEDDDDDDSDRSVAPSRSNLNALQQSALDAGWGIETNSACKDEQFIHMMEPRFRDLLSLRKNDDEIVPNKCFACDFIFSDDIADDIVYVNQWGAIVQLYRNMMCNGQSYTRMGNSLYKMFERTIVKQFHADGGTKTAEQLWSPYGIMYHFLWHHRELGMHVWVQFIRLSELFDTVMCSSAYSYHPETGRIAPTLKDLKRVDIAARMVDRHARLVKATDMIGISAPSTSAAKTIDVLDKVKKVLAPPGKRLVQKPCYAQTHADFRY